MAEQHFAGQAFNPQHWGDWFARSVPDLQLFATTNVHLLPKQAWDDYLRIARGDIGWDATLERYAVRTIVVDRAVQPTLAHVLRTSPENAAHRAEQMLQEKKELEQLLDEVRRSGGGSGEELVKETDIPLANGKVFTYRAARLRARDADDARVWGDAFLSSGRSGVAVLAAEMPGDKQSLFAFVTDDLIGRGVRADALIREVAAHAGGRGGGRPHMAQAGIPDASRLEEGLARLEPVVRALLGA